MLILLCLIFCCSAESRPGGSSRSVPAITWVADDDPYRSLLYDEEEAQPRRNKKRKLGDPDILSILRDLISVKLEDEDHERLSDLLDSNGKIKERKDGLFNPFPFICISDSRKIQRLLEAYRRRKIQEDENQLPRQGRQELRKAAQFQEGCQTTGYETQIREDCTPVTDTECKNVTVTRIRKKIDRQCTTKVRIQRE